MKIPPEAPAHPAAPARRFTLVVKTATPRRPVSPLPVGVRGVATKSAVQGVRVGAHAVAQKAARHGDALTQARAGMHRESERLADVRTQGHEARAEQLQSFVVEQLRDALLEEPPTPRLNPRTGETHAPVKEATAADAPEPTGQNLTNLSVEATLALVERIEVMVKAGRPALTFSLSAGFASEVSVERTGPGQVSVTLRARGKRPTEQQLSEICDALAARGLRLSKLSCP